MWARGRIAGDVPSMSADPEPIVGAACKKHLQTQADEGTRTPDPFITSKVGRLQPLAPVGRLARK